MDIAVVEYPKIAVVLAAVMIVLGLVVVALLRRDPRWHKRSQIQAMLSFILIGSFAIGLLSALRVLGVADAYGIDVEDRVFRITLIALRLFIIGALVYLIVLLRQEGEP